MASAEKGGIMKVLNNGDIHKAVKLLSLGFVTGFLIAEYFLIIAFPAIKILMVSL